MQVILQACRDKDREPLGKPDNSKIHRTVGAWYIRYGLLMH